MRDNDCGAIPVVEDMEKKRLAGMVTDRDLAIRGLGRIVEAISQPEPTE